MRLLLIGGTKFVGRVLVETALDRRHDVTLFNRGQTAPDLFPQVEHLRGDREHDLSALQGRTWDAVIDTCGYVPRVVRMSAELLADAVDHYTFISTISVYADTSTPGIDENAPLGTLADETTEEVTGETYGPLKVLCEQAAEQIMPGRVLIVRPGLIVGPYDPTDRFSYWVDRVAQGGDVLAPGSATRPIQFIDVRDLAEWTIQAIERRVAGTHNLVSPPYPTANGTGNFTMGQLLETCNAVSGSNARFVWIDEDFLLAHGVKMWSDLPLWVAESDPQYAGFMAVDSGKALANGVTIRPIDATVRDTLAWLKTQPSDHTWKAGLTREREAEVLQAWAAEKRR